MSMSETVIGRFTLNGTEYEVIEQEEKNRVVGAMETRYYVYELVNGERDGAAVRHFSQAQFNRGPDGQSIIEYAKNQF